jgi:hypothetical protein
MKNRFTVMISGRSPVLLDGLEGCYDVVAGAYGDVWDSGEPLDWVVYDSAKDRLAVFQEMYPDGFEACCEDFVAFDMYLGLSWSYAVA